MAKPIKVSKNCNKQRFKEAESYLLRIHDDIADIRHGFIRLGFHLAEIKECLYYQDAGYDDFYRFCEVNYGLEQTTVKRYMEVWHAFAEYDEKTYIRKMWIDEKYSGYSYSQLVELLPLDDEQRKEILPCMTVKEIRQKKKELREKKCDVAPKICRFFDGYACGIIDIQKKHFLKNGEVKGCAGCCQFCLKRKECDYVCDAVKNQKCDVAPEPKLIEPPSEPEEQPEVEKCDVAPEIKESSVKPEIRNAFVLLGADFEIFEIIEKDKCKRDAVFDINNTLFDNIMDRNYNAAYRNCLEMLQYLWLLSER